MRNLKPAGPNGILVLQKTDTSARTTPPVGIATTSISLSPSLGVSGGYLFLSHLGEGGLPRVLCAERWGTARDRGTERTTPPHH